MAGRKDRFDGISFGLYLALIVIGWFMQYAVGHSGQNSAESFGLQTAIGKHTMWVILSLVSFLTIQLIDARIWRTLAYPIYGLSLVLLVLVLLIGVEINDARSWFIVGGFSFQPSEFAKLGIVLCMASYLSSYQTRLKEVRSQITAAALVLVPSFLVLLQPDAGSALVFFSMVILFYREGLPEQYYVLAIYGLLCMIFALVFPLPIVMLAIGGVLLAFFSYNLLPRRYWIIGLLALVGLFIFHLLVYNLGLIAWVGILSVLILSTLIIAWRNRQQRVVWLMPIVILLGLGMASVANFTFENVLQSHHRDRIYAWLQPSKGDPQGALYNIIQSKVAIGSGGFTGKGFLEGSMTQLNYVPEQATDFIFSTIGEEQGFIGSLGVVLLFLGLMSRILFLSERRESDFTRIFGYGFVGILFCHFFINIGMTMGLVPVVGIPLPFISKGGSALLMFTIMLSIFLKMAKSRM